VHKARRWSRDFFGIGARNAIESDTVANFERCDTLSDLHNSASGLAANGHGQRRRMRVPPTVDFGEVQADGLNLDDCLTGPCFRIWNILVDQAFWPSWLVHAYCFHGNPP
jgi:hypothetical protein